MKYVKKFAAKLFDLWFPPKTDDQMLVDEIKQTVKTLEELGKDADKRGIFIWVRTTYDGTVHRPHQISYDEAYKTNKQTF